MPNYARLVAIALFLAAPAYADTAVPTSQAQVKLSFAPLVKQAAPAVVNIYTKSHITVQDQSPFMNDPFFQQFFARTNPGITFGGRPREQVISSLGSGVIVKPEGVVVTSLHVVKDAQEITVVLADNREFEAKIMLKDPRADLAFLQIQADKLPFIDLRDSDTLEVGELVLAIGNPFGVGQTVTNGIVSALARRAEGVSDYNFFIQTDAAINPGNSGGALVDMNGKLIGINTAIYSRSGGSMGIGFAIPANMVRTLLESKAEGGQVVRPWLGLAVQPVTAEVAESMGLKAPKGVLAKSIYPNSPAAKAGIKPGDVLLSLNGAALNSEQDLQYRLALSKVGGTGSFELLRAGQPATAQAIFTAAPESPNPAPITLQGKHPLSGTVVANLSPALAIELEMPDSAQGVVVTGFDQSQMTFNLGLSRGDIIMEVNGKKITSTQALVDAMNTRSKGWQIAYLRAGNIMTLTVRLP